MALVECYDPQGNKKLKEPVDARECVEFCGFSMKPPVPKDQAESETQTETGDSAETPELLLEDQIAADAPAAEADSKTGKKRNKG